MDYPDCLEGVDPANGYWSYADGARPRTAAKMREDSSAGKDPVTSLYQTLEVRSE